MNKLIMSLLKLMKELQMIEKILKDSKVVHMTVKDSSGSSLNRKKKYSFKISKERNTKVWTPHFGSMRFPLDGELDFYLKN